MNQNPFEQPMPQQVPPPKPEWNGKAPVLNRLIQANKEKHQDKSFNKPISEVMPPKERTLINKVECSLSCEEDLQKSLEAFTQGVTDHVNKNPEF
ncbi:hypothetical protein KC929_00355 [Patescibacteria group bacterium]|nr:hypothetical protein [Patescibacteria group bacterium]